MTSFGFPVGLLPSLVKVIDFNGASYLNDGYHRTFGLLDRGVTAVPAMVRTVDAYEDLNVPAGLLAQGQFLGSLPPLLPDYHDDEVSAEVQLPLMQNTVVIQAIELTQAG